MTTDNGFGLPLPGGRDPVMILAMFGKWPLLPGEDRKAYEALRDGAIAQFQPRDLLDYWDLRRAIDLIWEATRYQRCASCLIAITMKEALRLVLDGLKPATGSKNFSLEGALEGWFADTTKRIEIIQEFQRYGFDEDTPTAMAMAMRSGELARFSEIQRKNEVQAAAHLREILRRREAATTLLLTNGSSGPKQANAVEVTAVT
jgi:hypothetical protein